MLMTNQNQAQIIARIEDLKGDLALNFKSICELLTQLKSHYLHSDPLFRHYREVASEKLLPELVMAMGYKRGYLDHMAGRPRDVQASVARDGEISWACMVKGEVAERRTSWKSMDSAAFKRAFPKGQPPAPLSEQKAALLAEAAKKPPASDHKEPIGDVDTLPIAQVDLEAGTFRLGRNVVPLAMILAALAEVGIVPKP